ncbi:DNA cytosine methyltransferase [Streptomyces calidiresistens]|uniref:DNA (cytosine-5-)-methyltransferase n=1 Tax=Streptomyces calidiresistens TaxID=1485586 RepID=A0A7W3XYB4_9ACTN|nr:DNA (cytosine-5-)-methyltransferase [Streptomyces calidiresistens]MBB0231849.1 DNA (cytosine-5-)-methyltransferase [Streptomyces calidiresistens]
MPGHALPTEPEPRQRLIGSLCSGYGGLDLGVQAALGGRVAWHAEIDPGPSRVLARHWPGVPNLGDLTTVNWHQVPGVCVVTAGFPCQDLSVAGHRAGLAPGTRSGLWHHIARAIEALNPCLVVIENVRGILTAPAASPRPLEPCPWCLGGRPDQPVRALGAVLGTLAGLGFDARWRLLRAADVGAPHHRARIFLTAWRRAHGPNRHHRDGGRQPAPNPPRHRWSRSEPPTAADAEGDGRHQGLAEPAARQRRPHPPVGCRPVGTTESLPDRSAEELWGRYAAAISRWETLTRPAPPPTDAAGRLSPAFVEWMQGLPDGWVTATPGLGRPAQLTSLGNGVVPRQASRAIELLAPPLAHCPHHPES